MERGYPAGWVARLWRYPVKSLAPELLQAADVGPLGFEGDRERALIVETPEHARAGRPYRGKENNLLHTVADPERAIALAAGRGIAIAAHGGGPHFDAGAVSIIFDTWIGDLEALVERSLDPQRFRPNIFAIAEPGFVLREPDLVGARIEIGPVAFEALQTIGRCVTTTYDVDTGESDPDVLRFVAQFRNNVMGVYCSVATPGRIDVGMPLQVTVPGGPRAPSPA